MDYHPFTCFPGTNTVTLFQPTSVIPFPLLGLHTDRYTTPAPDASNLHEANSPPQENDEVAKITRSLLEVSRWFSTGPAEATHGPATGNGYKGMVLQGMGM